MARQTSTAIFISKGSIFCDGGIGGANYGNSGATYFILPAFPARYKAVAILAIGS